MRLGIAAAGAVMLIAGILGMTDIIFQVPGVPEHVLPEYIWPLLLIMGGAMGVAGLVLRGKKKEEDTISPNEMKSCPHCGMLIPADASRCEHCGIRFKSLYENLR